MNDHDLRTIGWKPFFQQQVDQEQHSNVVVARVSAHHGSQILLIGTEGEFSIPTQRPTPPIIK